MRPIPGDAGAPDIQAIFDANDDPWWIAEPGHYTTMACETMLNDGSGYQRVVAVELPVRLNHTTEVTVLRFMLTADQAAGLAMNLAHSSAFLAQLDD
jgi:hypothetical protein